MNTTQKFGYTLMGAGIILVGIIIGSAVSTLTAQPADKGFAEILEGGLSPDLGEILEGGLPLELQDYSDNHVKMVIGVQKACVERLGAAHTIRDLLELVRAYNMAQQWHPLYTAATERANR